MPVEFTELEPRRYAYLAHRGLYPEIGATFGRMAEIAGKAGLIDKPGALFVGVYHNDPSATPAGELRSDAGITVSEDETIPDDLEEGRIPGGRYAKGVHKGSYAKMGDSWGELWSAIYASGTKPRVGSPFELYMGDMDTTPEDELITELYVAVE